MFRIEVFYEEMLNKIKEANLLLTAKITEKNSQKKN